MTTEIIVPSPGESITEVEIADWLVGNGQEVAADEALCEIESEKVTLTVYAEAAGVVEQQAAAGDTVAVGAVIGHIKESSQPNDSAATVAKPEVKADVAHGNEDQAASGAGKTEDNSTPSGQTAGDTPEAKEDILKIMVPSPGESVSEVEISTWLKSDGDSVRKDEEIAEIESEKVTLTLYAEAAGVLHIKVAAGETIAVGSEVGHIDLSRAAVDSSERRASAVTEGEAPPPREQASSSPAKKVAAPPTPQKVSPTANLTAQVRAELDLLPRHERRERQSQLRRKLAERLVEVKNQTAMLTTFNEVDMSAVMRIRKQFKEEFRAAFDVNLGFMSFFTRAVTIALADYPAVNASIDGDEIVYHDYADVGIAVSTPKGLMVPILRNAERMSFAAIESGIAALAEKARTGKISMDELTGGTFTITNGGVFGSMLSTPILNPPQTGILGMHDIVQRPVAIDGEVHIRPIMFVALSYDHRVIDGRESVGFLVRVKELLEMPEKMLLGLPAGNG
jgi:2-oxoglutarate dehydrogenase E2 component (dihydrolipoamide succinyltransferase)